MSNIAPKLYYLASQFKVRIEVSKAICIANPKAIDNLLTRANQKLESIKAKGEIDFFVIYKDKIEKTWQRLLANESFPDDKLISFTVGRGGVNLKGFNLKFNTESVENFITLTIVTDPSILKTWPENWYKAAIDFQMQKELGKIFKFNYAQMQAAILRAKHNSTVVDVPISMLENNYSPEELKEKPFSIVANQNRKELILLIKSFPDTQKKATVKQLIQNIEKACQILQEKTGDKYTPLSNSIKKVFAEFENAPEKLNVDIPEAILVGISLNQNEVNTRNDQAIKLKISKDKMKASIDGFDMSLYEKITPPIDGVWLERQLEKLGLSKQSYNLYLKDAEKILKVKESLSGFTIAQGTLPKSMEKPYLYESYIDLAKNSKQESLDLETINLRESQHSFMVKSGDLIAEIKYENQGSPGEDIFGALILQTPLEELKIKTGEGIKVVDGKYYATTEGSPNIDPEKGISINKTLVHNDDVNLRTGNIIFDGPIEITGTVDFGATVYATGDITINGDVRGTVVSKGKIVVNGGIITGLKARVEAKGSISAEFIENSHIHCESDLKVKKALINSKVISGGNIIILDEVDGILAGGDVSCLHDIISKNLGFQRGAKTILSVGVDWRITRALSISKGRLEKMTNYNVEMRKELREIVSKKPNQVNKKLSELKEKLQTKLIKSRKIIEQLEAKIIILTSKVAYNMKSKVCVNGILCANVDISIGGSRVSLQSNLAGVAVTAKKRRGSNIIQIEDIEKELEEAS